MRMSFAGPFGRNTMQPIQGSENRADVSTDCVARSEHRLIQDQGIAANAEETSEAAAPAGTDRP